jgi:hypothetical protein
MSKTLWLVFLMGLGLLLAACSGSDATPTARPSDVKRITLEDAKTLLDNDTAVLYDTRTLNEYRRQHAAGAVLFPIGEEEARFGELPGDKTLIFYCV